MDEAQRRIGGEVAASLVAGTRYVLGPGSTMRSVAERLGVSVIGRHTALGDALVTGEIFLKLIPLLAEQGIVTLGQALDASRETFHARLQY